MTSRDGDAERGSVATAAGFLVAASTVPASFQRTLATRSTADQALVTGLVFVLGQTAVSAIASGLETAGDLLADDSSTDRPVPSRPVAYVAGGLLGAATALAAPRRDRERLHRAAVRTIGQVTAVAGAAGVVAGVVRGSALARRIPGGPRAAVAATAGLLAAVRHLDVRRRAALEDDLETDDVEAATAQALAMAAGVTVATVGLARAEGAAARRVAALLARVLPGQEAQWHPVGHLAVFGAVAASGRAAVHRVFGAIEGQQTSFEAALDVAPPRPEVSGSAASLVPFATMSKMGRRLVWTTRPPDEIERVMGVPAVEHPVRAYAGLLLAEDPEERVRIVLDDLERAGGLDRSWLLVASPTGTGYVNYAAVGALEMMTRGDCATVAMQYSARPSPISLDRVDRGREQFRLLVDALGERLAGRETRPTVVVFGESLGAWTSQDAFLHRGTAGLVEAGIDRALWIGTPFESKWKDQVLDDDRDDVDRDTIGVLNGIEDWNALGPAARDRIRYVMLTHHDDGVAHFGASLLIRRPDWLGPPESRPSGVPRSERWAPITTFVLTLIDMKNAARVVPGQFAARGHDYRADLPEFIRAVLDLDVSDEQVARVTRALEAEEASRTTWIAEHKAVGAGMANDLMRRIRRDHPEAFEAAFRDLTTEVRGWRAAWEAGELDDA